MEAISWVSPWQARSRTSPGTEVSTSLPWEKSRAMGSTKVSSSASSFFFSPSGSSR